MIPPQQMPPLTHREEPALSPDEVEGQGPAHVPRVDATASASHVEGSSEALACCPIKHGLSWSDKKELIDMYHAGVPVEVMLASYYQKRGSKEIPHVTKNQNSRKRLMKQN